MSDLPLLINLDRDIYGKHPSHQSIIIAEVLNELIRYLSDSQQAPSLSATDSNTQ